MFVCACLLTFSLFLFFPQILLLQWMGEPDLRSKMQGRLILVHLMCRDMAAPQSIETIIGIDNDITGKSSEMLICLFSWMFVVTIFGFDVRCNMFPLSFFEFFVLFSFHFLHIIYHSQSKQKHQIYDSFCLKLV